MPAPAEGYVLHTYGPEHYVQHAVASVVTLRRYDAERPVALFCPPDHAAVLARHGLDVLFDRIEPLPEAHQSIVGFKHHLFRFKPYARSLFIDADIVWCRHPDALWTQLSAYPFTATGLGRADFFFGGPKGVGVLLDILLNRRQRTLKRFGLTYLPRVQAGLIYAQDDALTQTVCQTAAAYLSRHAETHFRSRLHEGRNEESCEWSMAMAMSRLALPVYPWYQGHNSPQLDFIEAWTTYDPDFEHVACRYYCDRFIYEMRSFPRPRLQAFLMRFFTTVLRRGDYLEATPFALHFGSLRHKQPFYDFSTRTWSRLTEAPAAPVLTPQVAS